MHPHIASPCRTRRRRVAGLGLALALAAGCGGADEREARWEYIATVILAPNCATSSCHSRAAAAAGLDFSDPERGYTSLTGLKTWIVDPRGGDGCRAMQGHIVCQRNHRPMVTPYNPEQSRLVNMLRARNAPRMPPDRPLPEASIRLVERWVRAGAAYDRTKPPEPSDGGRPPITVTVTVSDGGDEEPDAGAPVDAGGRS